MKRKSFACVLTAVLCLTAMTGCAPLLVGGLASLASFGAGYWTALQNPQVQVTRDFYIDGIKVENPAALGLQ